MKASISLDELKAQNVILHARITRVTRETSNGEEGMAFELALNGCTSECLQAVTELMVAVAVQTATEDGELNPLHLALNAMMIKRNFKKALLDRVKAAGTMGTKGDENARYQ